MKIKKTLAILVVSIIFTVFFDVLSRILGDPLSVGELFIIGLLSLFTCRVTEAVGLLTQMLNVLSAALVLSAKERGRSEQTDPGA